MQSKNSKRLSRTEKLIIAVLVVGISIFAGISFGKYVYNQGKKSEQEQRASEQSQAQQTEFKNLTRKTELDSCLQNADTEYWKYVELNATSVTQDQDEPVYRAPESVWTVAKDRKKTDTDNCYRRYEVD